MTHRQPLTRRTRGQWIHQVSVDTLSIFVWSRFAGNIIHIFSITAVHWDWLGYEFFILFFFCPPYIWKTSCGCLWYVNLHTNSQNCKCVVCPWTWPSAWTTESWMPFWMAKVMVSAEGMKAAREAEVWRCCITSRRADWRTNRNRCLKRIKENYQVDPFPTLAEKTSYDAYNVHKLDFKYATVKDLHCRTICMMFLVGKIISSQLELIERLDIVWDADFPCSIKPSVREGRGCGKQVKMTSKTPGHLTSISAWVSNKEHVHDILAGNL